MAEHDAVEQAKKIAEGLATVSLPNALRSETVSAEAIEQFRAAPAQPERDPIRIVSGQNGPVVACVFRRTGGLLYPPPRTELPLPKLVDSAELTDRQRTLWLEIQSAIFEPVEVDRLTNLVNSFVETQPPPRLAGLAEYQTAVLLAEGGRRDRARELFERTIQEHPDVLTESGWSLRTFAEIQLLGLATPPAEVSLLTSAPTQSFMERLLDSLCSRAVVEPSPLSELVLAKATEAEAALDLPPKVRRLPAEWTRVWQLHEAARALAAEIDAVLRLSSPEVRTRLFPSSASAAGSAGLPGSAGRAGDGEPRKSDRNDVGMSPITDNNARNGQAGTAFWLPLADFDGASEQSTASWENLPRLLLISDANDDVVWWLAWPESKVREAVQRALQAQVLPSYFGLSVTLAGRPVAEARAGSPSLATVASPQMKTPPLHVSVQLIDSAALYARQRLRTLWFGSLIALSTGAVLVGFLAAWRAFRSQRQLSELKSNFVSSVSHEIRAPIASVRLMAEELQEIEPRDRPKSQEYHRFIVQECRRLSALIENVLDFSRIEQGRKQFQFEPLDLVALVEETAKLMQPCAAERGIELKLSLDDARLPVEEAQPCLDGRAIQQALVNLIDNAIKHSPKGSTVTIGLDVDPTGDGRPADVTPVRGAPAGTGHRQTPRSSLLGLQLWVEDQGEGIPPQDQERIFERFYRRGTELRRETQGVGLGLAIVKYVTEAHGGRVMVRSAVNQGSRFTVKLPMEPGLARHTNEMRTT